MITSIRIENFRGIRSGELTELKPLTILTGTNGCGKSAVLDALLIAANPSPAEGVVRAVQRHPVSKDGARWLVYQHAEAATIVFRFSDATETWYTLRLTSHRGQVKLIPAGPRDPSIPVSIDVSFDKDNRWTSMSGGRLTSNRPSSVRLSDPGIPVELHPLYSEAVREGREDDVTALLRAIVPEAEGLRILTESDNTPALYLKKAGGAVPASLSGDGVQSFLQLALEIAATPGGLVLVEEPEVYQHPAAIEKTAQVLRESARRGVQTVITTHSLELIDCLVNDADEQSRNDTALYILQLTDGELRTSRYAGEALVYARQEAETDLR